MQFRAPEVNRQIYDERCDVWSIGILMYMLLSGTAPFDGENEEEIEDKVEKGEYTMDDPIWDEIS